MNRKQYIRFGAWLNTEYGSLVLQAYREQAIRFIQRRIRAKRIAQGKSVSIFTKNNFSLSDSLLKVIAEPTDNTYLTHAKIINSGQYGNLNFKDPNFIENIFKALRLNNINLNQMIIAHDIHDAKKWLHNYDYDGEQLSFYSFDDPNGPYQPSKITYASADEITQFRNTLQPQDKQYAIINFPKTETILFFIEGTKKLNNDLMFVDMLNKYLLHLPLKMRETAKNLVQQIQQNEPTTRKTAEKALINLLDKQLTQKQIQHIKLNPKTHSTIGFLTSILRLKEQNPSIIISPNYREDNPNSPIIAFVIPTLKAETQLQLTLHKEETILPTPTAGMISTRMIRALFEKPSIDANINASNSDKTLYHLYHDTYQNTTHRSRPIEITHPSSLVSNTKPHEIDSYDFILTFHDKLHAWRAASHTPFFHHLLKLLSEDTLCNQPTRVMNKKIWELADMDFSYGNIFRIAKAINFTGDLLINRQQTFFFEILNSLIRPDNTESHSLFLRIAIDMIINASIWDRTIKYIQTKPTPNNSIFSIFTTTQLPKNSDEKSAQLQLKFAKLLSNRHIVNTIINAKDRPIEEIILKVHLNNLPNTSDLFCLLEKSDLKEIFEWNLHYQLCFRPNPKLSSLPKNLSLDDQRHPDILKDTLVKILIELKANKIKEKICEFNHDQNREQIESLFLNLHNAFLQSEPNTSGHLILQSTLKLLLMIDHYKLNPHPNMLAIIESSIDFIAVFKNSHEFFKKNNQSIFDQKRKTNPADLINQVIELGDQFINKTDLLNNKYN